MHLFLFPKEKRLYFTPSLAKNTGTIMIRELAVLVLFTVVWVLALERFNDLLHEID